jgi:phosphoribosyl 1,2-cyclic phosphate phosphodiesterase
VRITFLGTGTSQGIPVIACQCEVCTSNDNADNRLRSSILIEINEKIIVIDTGPDFRQQMLREKVAHLDAVLLTHLHKDHIAGLDDIRAFNYRQQKPMDVYADERTTDQLKREFPYIFDGSNYPGIPQINLHLISPEPFTLFSDIQIIPIPVLHHKLPVLGFRIKDFAYITDANYIPEHSFEKLNNLAVLVINALHKKPHISHFNLSEALSIIQQLKPQRAFITHISHLMGKHQQVSIELPPSVALATDGLTIEINSI